MSALLVAEGETIAVGSPIIAIEDGVAAEPPYSAAGRHGCEGTG